ncbi:hypothetical protein HK105_207499 [Polyrhizophydium stewartii]|uniref:Uncharacterized protein n=1 Tax=Polyrhizophydium stewartii TaxID=2732419 RepID=A0ABR4N0J0_9FUNG|nr:hypothetical protein HK105_006355 [Polyrhizophydium stewartii]
MSAVVRELWGRYPSFLKLGPKTLLHLVGDLPAGGKGCRVVPAVWIARGKKASWYEVDRIEYDRATSNATIYGYKVMDGVRSPEARRIGTAFEENWRFYEAPEDVRTIERKLNLETV